MWDGRKEGYSHPVSLNVEKLGSTLLVKMKMGMVRNAGVTSLDVVAMGSNKPNGVGNLNCLSLK